MTSTFRRLGQSELLPRYIFAESLYARRRVLEIGAVASTLGQSARFLSTRGARVVVAADSDLAAVQEAQSRLSGPNLRFRPPVFDDFESGSFDLVIVADLSTYVRAPELLKELARLVAKNGYLMGGLRNPAGLALSSISDPEDAEAPPTYGQLLDALTTHFNSIEVATQSPVLGYQIAFERGEGLQVDGSLAGHSEAAYYVVLAGQEAVRNFDPTWVQLPPEPLAFTGGRLEDASRRATEWKDRTTRLKEVLATKTTELTSRESELKEMMAQLEGAKDGVSRLTAQLETAREAPETLRERDDLANRIRRLEAELTVARERASDAEGRATAARGELEAFARAQKDAALQTLASQELARLERARREEVATQLEDSRNRLASAYEDLRRAQEQAATERIDHERTRVTSARLTEGLAAKEADLAAARDRELRLSDARTQALQAIEGLENSLAQARHQLVELREDSSKRDAERVSLERSLDVERTTRAGLKADIEREAARARALQEELEHKSADLSAVETELQSTRSAQARALRDIETLSTSERTWREIAQQTDQRLIDTTANVQTLSDQLAQAEAEKEALIGRTRRLELDLTTVINTERGLREQTEAQLAVTSTSLKETSDDRDALIGERDDLRGALEDLKKARTSDQGQVDALAAERRRLDAEVNELQAKLTAAIREHDEAQLVSQAKEQMLQARLNEHITSLAHETKALEEAKAQLAQLEQSLQTTSEALTEAQRKGSELESGLDERTGQLIFAQQELAAARTRAGQAEQGLGETRTSAEELQARLSEATNELERVRAELTTTREEFAARESKLVERRELIDLEKIALEKSYKNLEATAKLAVERATDLEERVGELAKQLRLEEDERRAERRQLEEGLEWHRGELASERQMTAQQKVALAKQVADSQAAVVKQQAEAQAAITAAAEQVRVLQAELETLRSQERGLQAERTSLTEALVAARSSNAELRTETEQNHSRIAALSAEVEARTRQVTATQLAQAIAMDDAAVARASVVALESTREQLQNEVSRLTALTLEHETRFAESTKALLAVQGSSDEVSTRLTAALAEVAHLKAELEAGLDARVVERALLTKTESERDAATNELATLKAAISERDAEVLRLSASLSELETTKQSVESQQSSLQLQLTAIQEQLATSKAQGVELEQKLTGLTTELQETAARATRIDAALESTKQEHQATLMALREELEAARASATRALEAKASEADATLAERDARIAALETSNTERVAATEAAQAGLSAARAAAEQKASEQAQALASLGEQLAEAKANIGRAQSEARGHQLGKQQNQVEIERLKAELATAQSSLSAVGGETKSIIAAREAIESTAQETAQKLKLAEDERGALAAQLATAAQERSALAAKVEALQVSAAQLDVVTQERTALSEKVEALEASAAQATAEATKTRAELQANEEERAALAMKLEAEIKAVDDERTSLAIQVQSLQSSLAQANADVLEATKPIAPGEEWGVYRERIQSLEAQLEASQTAGTTDATARRQAEELLLLLREKYGDLQHELSQATEALIALRRDTGRTAALVEQVSELQTENVLIEQERERLAQRVEELERELQLPLAAEFDNPTRPYQIPLDVPPLEEPRLPGVARQRRTPTGEFEIFELDVDDSGLAGEAEEIVLLEEEATDPGRKKPEKK